MTDDLKTRLFLHYSDQSWFELQTFIGHLNSRQVKVCHPDYSDVWYSVPHCMVYSILDLSNRARAQIRTTPIRTT